MAITRQNKLTVVNLGEQGVNVGIVIDRLRDSYGVGFYSNSEDTQTLNEQDGELVSLLFSNKNQVDSFISLLQDLKAKIDAGGVI